MVLCYKIAHTKYKELLPFLLYLMITSIYYEDANYYITLTSKTKWHNIAILLFSMHTNLVLNLEHWLFNVAVTHLQNKLGIPEFKYHTSYYDQLML